MAPSAADIIRTYRKAADLSQEDLAGVLGVSFGAVSQWETGRTSPRRAVAMRLDQHLGADGAIMAALGYAPPSDQAGEVARLQGELSALLERSTATFELVRAVLDELRLVRDALARAQAGAQPSPVEPQRSKKPAV